MSASSRRGLALSSERSSLTPILLGLTAVTGLIDAVSYLALGRVFTANMTGNVVFLGFAAAGAPGLSVARSAAALVAFLAGAAIGGRLGVRMGGGPRHRWTGVAFGAEAGLLLAATLVCLGTQSGTPDVGRLYSVIVLTGLAMGLRNATVRKLGVPDLTTTVLTLTLTGLAAESILGEGKPQRSATRAGSVVTMLVGAVVGAWLLRSSASLALAVATAISSLCATAAWRLRDE
jgi:uncharacterized membrane protein YoaK (UPF0700 family)